MLDVLLIMALAFGFCIMLALLPAHSPHVRIALGVLLLVFYAGIVLAFTLPGRDAKQPGAALFSEIILSVLLFVPLGALLPYIWNTYRKSVGTGKGMLAVAAGAFIVSLALELSQWKLKGGLLVLDDLLTNTLGAVLGYLVYRYVLGSQLVTAKHLRRNKRWWLGLLSLLAAVGIFYLTCQAPSETTMLSTVVVRTLNKLGIVVTSKMVRHYVHYVMYFGLGIMLFIWKHNLRMLLLGCLIGLADECLKIWLPTREFDGTDLVRDVVGLLLAYLVVAGVRAIARRASRSDA